MFRTVMPPEELRERMKLVAVVDGRMEPTEETLSLLRKYQVRRIVLPATNVAAAEGLSRLGAIRLHGSTLVAGFAVFEVD